MSHKKPDPHALTRNDLYVLTNDILGDPPLQRIDTYEADNDGLIELPWQGRLWLVPPRGMEVREWVDRFLESWDTQEMIEGVLLLPARTDTRWFNRLVSRGPAICFVQGRLTTLPNERPNSVPTILAYLGPRWRRWLRDAPTIGPTALF